VQQLARDRLYACGGDGFGLGVVSHVEPALFPLWSVRFRKTTENGHQ
jgi:hypothetical protein